MERGQGSLSRVTLCHRVAGFAVPTSWLAGALLVLPGEGALSEHGLRCLACLRQGFRDNHGINSVGESLRDNNSPACVTQHHHVSLDHGTQCQVNLLQHPQGQRLHCLPGQTVPVFNPFCEEILNVQPKPSVVQVKTMSSS